MKSFRNSIKRFFDIVFNNSTLDLAEVTNDCLAVIRNAKSIYNAAMTAMTPKDIQQAQDMKESLRNMEMNLYNKYEHVCITERDLEDFRLIWITELICLIDQCDDLVTLEEYGPLSLGAITIAESGEDPADE